MNGVINNFNQKELSGRDARLWKEWKELDTLCAKRKAAAENPRNPSLSYIIRRKNIMGLSYGVRDMVSLQIHRGCKRRSYPS